MTVPYEYPELKYRVGDAVTDDKGRTLRIDGIKDNASPKKCYRCRHINTGRKVVVLHEVAIGRAVQSVWWCTACVNDHFDRFHATLESEPGDDEEEGPF